MASIAGSWALIAVDGFHPAPDISPEEVHSQIEAAQALGAFLLLPALLIAINPRLGSAGLLVSALALIVAFGFLSHIGVLAALPGAFLLLIAAATAYAARGPDQSKAHDAGAPRPAPGTTTNQVRWPRFDPNIPGDLERAVKEVRRIQAEEKAREKELT
jgi:hypothetical protein